MARSPIEIPIASETGAFEKGIKSGVIEPIADAEKALKDLAGTRGPEQLEREMRDAQKQTKSLADETERAARAIESNFNRAYRETKQSAESDMRAAQKQTKSLADETERAARVIDVDFKRAYREAKQSADDGLDGISRHTQEATGELKQNLGETFSSFRGDLEDLPQIAQDVFGGMASSVGGLGASLALAAAAGGVGLLIEGFLSAQRDAEKLREKIGAIYQEAAEEGRSYLTTQQMIAAQNDLMFNPDRAEEYKNALSDQRALGIDLSVIIDAMNGDLSAQETVMGAVNSQMEKYENTSLNRVAQFDQEAKKLDDMNSRWKGITQATQDSAAAADQSLKLTSDRLLRAAADAGTATQEVDEFGNKLLTLPDGQQVLISAETGLATQNVNQFKGDVDGIPETVTTTARIIVDDRDLRNYRPPTITVPGQIVARGTVAQY